MKLLSRPEEIFLLAIWKLQDDAYAVTIRDKVKELTGKDYSSEFSYSSEGEAEALIAQKGELVDFIGGILGKPSFELKDGDPCIVNLPIVGQACGIKLSNHIVCLTEKGMVRVPDRYLVAGWSV